MKLNNFEIVAGSYEEFLLGYKIVKKKEYKLVQSFANHSHHASIRCVAAGGKYLASGGADESIQLYDLKLRKETGLLSQHTGTVTCLTFSPNGSHLLSGSEDGSIAICRTGSWQMEKMWKEAHKGGGGVISVACHPSGKMALSVGTDAVLRTWNLIKGRLAYAKNLGGGKRGVGRSISFLSWSPNGDFYILVIDSKVDIYSVETAAITYTINCNKKVSSFCFTENHVLILGFDDGEIDVYNILKCCKISTSKLHGTRVKCLSVVQCDTSKFLVSASSSGQIALWKYSDFAVSKLCEVETGCRITCLVIIQQMATQQVVKIENDSINSDCEQYEQITDESALKARSDNNTSMCKKKKRKKSLESSNKVVIEKPKKPKRTSLNATQEWIVEDI